MTTYRVPALSIALIALLLFPALSRAAEIVAGEQASLPAGTPIAHNAYLAGGAVVSGAAIGGDLSVAGGTIVVNGPVAADLLAAGGNISILGDVRDDARIAGGTIVISGSVGNDLVVAGGTITAIGPKVGGDALIFGGNVRLASPVSGNVMIRGGNITIDAPVSGNVEVHAQNLTLGSHAVISGNLTYEATKAATMDAGAAVKGQTAFTPIVNVKQGPAAAVAIFSVWLLSIFAALLVCALIIRMLIGRYTLSVARAALARPWHSLLVGFIGAVVLPVAAAVMMFTVVGIPLGILTALGYVALLVFSWLFAPLIVGSFIEHWWHSRAPEMPWQVVIYGVVAYVVIGLIPLIGWLFKALVLLIAFGAILEKKREIFSEWV